MATKKTTIERKTDVIATNTIECDRWAEARKLKVSDEVASLYAEGELTRDELLAHAK